jgi:simple sugar transport system ATP-binding protein
MQANSDALDLVAISKRFGAATALEAASLRVRQGTVHALLGENGAGKTTLMRVAFGSIRPDAGQVLVHGRQVEFRSPAQAIAAGIGMVHQHFTLVPEMTVAENIALGGHGRLRLGDVEAAIRDISARTGFDLDPSARVDTLPVGAQQRVEIAKALARRASILIMDEPTAVLAPAEVDDLLRWLRQFAADGNTAILITHKLHEALDIAADVTVLRRGRVVHTGGAATATAASLTTAMLGAQMGSVATPEPPSDVTMSAVVFRAERIVVCDPRGVARVRDASFVIRTHEIVGVAAIEGSGQRELLRALAGRQCIDGGTLERPAHVGFVPEDRQGKALLLDRALVENIALRDAGERRGLLRWRALRERTASLMAAYDVRALSEASVARTLSGGNQQKLVLAREIEGETPPAAIVLENPTRGLDVRATAEVHARLRAARDAGTAVVVYSSDLDEVLALSTRVFVMRAGSVREVAQDRDAVGRAMLGLDR